MRVLAIDPGTTESAYIILESDESPSECNAGKVSNSHLRHIILDEVAVNEWANIVIESIEGYGMPVGKATFLTAYWIGRFIECALPAEVVLMPRKKVKSYVYAQMKVRGTEIRNYMKVKDKHIRQEMLDHYGPQGRKKTPGPTYGFKADMWSALAIATTFVETRGK